MLPTDEITTARYFGDCLEIYEAGANVIYRKDVTHFGAEKKLILTKLKDQIQQYMIFFCSIIKRISEKRNIRIAGILEYLKAPNQYDRA